MNNTCKVMGCESVIHARGCCSKHYRRLMKYGDENHLINKKFVVNFKEDIKGCYVETPNNENKLYIKKTIDKLSVVAICSNCGEGFKVTKRNLPTHSGNCTKCRSTRHGMTGTPIYKVWSNMRYRCNNKKGKDYDRYGGRGITFYEGWENFTKFRKWALNNGYKEGLTIDRININGNYEPNNCQFLTIAEHNVEDKSIFTLDEKIKNYKRRVELGITQSEMAKILNVSQGAVSKHEKEIIESIKVEEQSPSFNFKLK